jgi:hypothetical protein
MNPDISPESETDELIEHVLLRPRMFCPEAETLRELMLFISGICVGRSPPHGRACVTRFADDVEARFGHPRNVSWTEVLLREFGGLPYLEACDAIVKLLRESRTRGPSCDV